MVCHVPQLREGEKEIKRRKGGIRRAVMLANNNHGWDCTSGCTLMRGYSSSGWPMVWMAGEAMIGERRWSAP